MTGTRYEHIDLVDTSVFATNLPYKGIVTNGIVWLEAFAIEVIDAASESIAPSALSMEIPSDPRTCMCVRVCKEVKQVYAKMRVFRLARLQI